MPRQRPWSRGAGYQTTFWMPTKMVEVLEEIKKATGLYYSEVMLVGIYRLLNDAGLYDDVGLEMTEDKVSRWIKEFMEGQRG